MAQSLGGKRVAILLTDGFEQIEMTSPREALERLGARCLIVSPKEGEVQGFNHHDKADRFKVDLPLARATADEFDAVLLPGGVINGDALRMDKSAQQFVKAIEGAGKPILVICHGGWILVSSRLVKGHTMTSWPTLQDDIRNAGGIWTDQEVVRDRNWVSSRKPGDLPSFNQEIIDIVAEWRSPRAGDGDPHEVRP
jgi:protease I